MTLEYGYVMDGMATVRIDEDALISLKKAFETDIRLMVTHSTDLNSTDLKQALPLIKNWETLDELLQELIEQKEKNKANGSLSAHKEDDDNSPLPF